MTESKIEDLIASFDELYQSLIDFDIECIKQNKRELYSGFHINFYSLRDKACAFLSSEHPEHLPNFKQVCNYSQPATARDNIQAMQWPKACIDYLQRI